MLKVSVKGRGRGQKGNGNEVGWVGGSHDEMDQSMCHYQHGLGGSLRFKTDFIGTRQQVYCWERVGT